MIKIFFKILPKNGEGSEGKSHAKLLGDERLRQKK